MSTNKPFSSPLVQLVEDPPSMAACLNAMIITTVCVALTIGVFGAVTGGTARQFCLKSTVEDPRGKPMMCCDDGWHHIHMPCGKLIGITRLIMPRLRWQPGIWLHRQECLDGNGDSINGPRVVQCEEQPWPHFNHGVLNNGQLIIRNGVEKS